MIPRPSEKENVWRSFIMGMSREEMKNVGCEDGESRDVGRHHRDQD